MALDIGRVAYQGYYDALKGIKVLPKWEDLSQEEANAWRHAGVAVFHYEDEMRKQREENPDIVG